MPTGTENHRAPSGPGYELRDVNVRFLAAVVVGIFLLTLAGMGASWWFQSFVAEEQRAADRRPPPLAQTLPAAPPEPRLQVAPRLDLSRIRAEEDATLNRYEWIDPKSGIVRIPIDRAMDLLAQRGLPARPQPARQAAPASEESGPR